MKGVEFYYQKFELLLKQWDEGIAHEFRQYADTHTPNYVYLWLEEKKKENDGFPKEIWDLMGDFYWDIR